MTEYSSLRLTSDYFTPLGDDSNCSIPVTLLGSSIPTSLFRSSSFPSLLLLFFIPLLLPPWHPFLRNPKSTKVTVHTYTHSSYFTFSRTQHLNNTIMYTASFAFFEALWEAGITHCFVNLGSDHPSIIEAIVKGQREKKGQFPRMITCPNEVCIPSII